MKSSKGSIMKVEELEKYGKLVNIKKQNTFFWQ